MSQADLAGRTFGRLTVVRLDVSHAGKNPRWLCRCECGTEKSIRASSLIRGHSQSCGCYRAEVLCPDLTGQTFNRFTVLRRGENTKIGQASWICRCDCGEIRSVKTYSLKSGNSKSCGCYHRDAITKHGQVKSPEHRSWGAMKSRCLNPGAAGFESYGGRGITVCERWAESFEAFLEDMGPRPSPRHSIDRINSDGNYEPGNCRWADPRTQGNNRRNNVRLTCFGETLTLAQWARKVGLRRNMIEHRLNIGWPLEDALTKPSRKDPKPSASSSA